MRISDTDIEIVYDYRPDYYNIPSSRYMIYAPFSKPDIQKYRQIQFDKKSEIGYIHYKTNDTWIYVTSTLIPYESKLQNDIFAEYKKPSVFYIAYTPANQFIIYYSSDIYRQNIYYVVYTSDKKIKLVDGEEFATRFDVPEYQ